MKLNVAYIFEGLVCGNMDKKLVDLDTLCLVTDVNFFKSIGWGFRGFSCLAQHITEFRE